MLIPIFILTLIPILSVVSAGISGPPQEADCCKAKSSIWLKYNRELNLNGLCKVGYRLPPNIQSYEAELAARCLTSSQKKRIRNPSNGYFLVTDTSLNNCYHRPSECKKYIMICVKENCTSPEPTGMPKHTYSPTEAPTLAPFDCETTPIIFTTSIDDSTTPNPYLNWQHSFPVRIGISTDQAALPGQIKFFWNYNAKPFPNDVIPCDGHKIPYDTHPMLQFVLQFDQNYDGHVPNCEDRVIIKYSDQDGIYFGKYGGMNSLSQFDVEHDHNLTIDLDEQKCHFDDVEYLEISNSLPSQAFSQMQPYLALNILIATDFASDFRVGELVLFAAPDIEVPESSGLIPCDGSKYLQDRFPDLFSIVQDKYFSNSTHFGIPDCRGKAVISTENDNITGTFDGTVTSDNIPKHDHTTVTIPLTSNDACTAEIDVIEYDNECTNVSNIMPVLPVLFVLNHVTQEFSLFIPEIDDTNLLIMQLNGIPYGSDRLVTETRGSDIISCDEIPFNHRHQYQLKCFNTPTPTADPINPPTTFEPSQKPTETPTSDPTSQPTPEPTPKPTQSPTKGPTYLPTMQPTSNPTNVPTNIPTTEPTSNPTEIPTLAPTPFLCEFGPLAFLDYEFAIIVDNSCGLTDEECNTQLSEIGQLLYTIKINESIAVAYIEYGSKSQDAVVKIGLNDPIQNDITAFHDYIIDNGGCGDGVNNDSTDLVSGIDLAVQLLNDSIPDPNVAYTYRKIFVISNCENNVQDTSTEICDRLYNTLEFDMGDKPAVDRVIINVAHSSQSVSNYITNASDYLSCFVRQIENTGLSTGRICAGQNDYEYTLDNECTEGNSGICEQIERSFQTKPTRATAFPTQKPTPNPTSNPTSSPTPNPTFDPTSEPTLEPTVNPTDTPSSNPTLEPTINPTAFPTYFPTDIPTDIPTDLPTYFPTEIPTESQTNLPTVWPTKKPTEMCKISNSEWNKWSEWSQCRMYRDANETDHFKHIHYRTRECVCIGHGNEKKIVNQQNCHGQSIDIAECESDCNTIWSPWCPWSVCIIQNFACVTDMSGHGVCKGFQFRTRSCLKELPNNRREDCNGNCTCEADEFGNSTNEIRDCEMQHCLHITFDDNGDNTCITPPQWRVEDKKSKHTIQQGGNVGDECIPVKENEPYLLIVNRGCGSIKWYYKGQMIDSFDYNPHSNHEYMHKTLQIKVKTPQNNNNQNQNKVL